MLIEILCLIVIIIGVILLGTAKNHNNDDDYFVIIIVFAVVGLLNVSVYAISEAHAHHQANKKYMDYDI